MYFVNSLRKENLSSYLYFRLRKCLNKQMQLAINDYDVTRLEKTISIYASAFLLKGLYYKTRINTLLHFVRFATAQLRSIIQLFPISREHMSFYLPRRKNIHVE